MVVNPYNALVGKTVEVAMLSGKAKKALYAKLFPSSRNSGPCDRGSGDALTALEFSSVTRLLYRERQDREGQGRRDLESERKSERKRKKKAAAGKKPAAAPIRQTSLRSSGLRTQDSGLRSSGSHQPHRHLRQLQMVCRRSRQLPDSGRQDRLGPSDPCFLYTSPSPRD